VRQQPAAIKQVEGAEGCTAAAAQQRSSNAMRCLVCLRPLMLLRKRWRNAIASADPFILLMCRCKSICAPAPKQRDEHIRHYYFPFTLIAFAFHIFSLSCCYADRAFACLSFSDMLIDITFIIFLLPPILHYLSFFISTHLLPFPFFISLSPPLRRIFFRPFSASHPPAFSLNTEMGYSVFLPSSF